MIWNVIGWNPRRKDFVPLADFLVSFYAEQEVKSGLLEGMSIYSESGISHKFWDVWNHSSASIAAVLGDGGVTWPI